MSNVEENNEEIIPFYEKLHIDYIVKISLLDKESFEYVMTQHFRMSGIYWGITSMCLLGRDINTEMNGNEIINWVMQSQDKETGGFGGSVGHDPHILYTLSALQILALYDKLDLVDPIKIATYISTLQQPDGSFAGDKWGEIDTRFSYCSLLSLTLLGKLHDGFINVEKAVDFIVSCKNFDGGFGAVPSAESHAGQIFCCVASLSLCHALHHIDNDLLSWWLCERQCDSGGLNGRPEKQADVCYSWWILSCLSILGRISWIDENKLIKYILECQDNIDGGISDRPGNMTDIFHTFFGLCGLSLLQYFKQDNKYINYNEIDPTFALPKNIIIKLNLSSQKL